MYLQIYLCVFLIISDFLGCFLPCVFIRLGPDCYFYLVSKWAKVWFATSLSKYFNVCNTCQFDGVYILGHSNKFFPLQVLELGIVSHSIIIGVSLGVSESPCTIRPLLVALSFHQFFEGFALGGCISQAQFSSLRSTVMATFFAITTPLGIAIGIGAASSYDPHSPRALVVEGILNSISAGILVYMALVDLIAADFLSKRMSCNTRLQVVSYFALFLGAGLMSLLAIWAWMLLHLIYACNFFCFGILLLSIKSAKQASNYLQKKILVTLLLLEGCLCNKYGNLVE